MGKGDRESNIELLRIVSMLMVLVVHMDGATVGLPDSLYKGIDARGIWRLFVESAVIIGVNCFTLISGYFGIRLRMRSVVAYLFQCVFYAVGIATLACIYNPAKYNIDYWLESWMVLTHTDLWYIPAYFCLMLLSPMINNGMESLSRERNMVLVGAFVLFNIWAGWWWEGKFNPTGYTVMQLIMVYMIGRFMAIYRDLFKMSAIGWCMVYFAATTAVFLSASVLPNGKVFAYNSPFVLLSSVAFFNIFLHIKLKSSVINYIARSAFATYLVHKAPVVWGGFLKPFMYGKWCSLSLSEYTLLMIVMAIGIYLVVMLLDIVRRFISDFIIRFKWIEYR